MTKVNDTRNENARRDADREDATKTPESLEREVDQARARLGRTASELSDRFSPGELLDQALGMAREHGGDFGRNLGSQVKNNPMPMILTSVGVAWMMMSSGDNGAAHGQSTHGATPNKHGRRVKSALDETAATSRDKAAAMGDRVHGATANLTESAQNAQQSLGQFYREQPLIAGSLGIAIGAALGALVPPTEIEDDMLGEASDRSLDTAKSEAASKYDEVREAAQAK